MQAAYSDRQTISITKMFDKDPRTRSVYSILKLIKKHAPAWRLRSPERLRSVLIGAGSDAAKVEAMDDATLVREVVSHYEATLPNLEDAEACDLSRSLDKLLVARNRVLVHSDADVPADRSWATWDEAEALVDCAKEFAATIAWAFRNLTLDLPGGRYYLTDSSRAMARDLERLLGMAGLTA